MNDSLSVTGSTFLADVLAGLHCARKSIPPKYFYDEEGSRIFDEITQLPEYYPTRTETAIMQRDGAQIAATLGEHVRLVEYGSGSSVKTRILLDELRHMSGYVPVDISGPYLHEVADGLRRDYPHVPVQPIVADFTEPFDLPATPDATQRCIVYFPGSTIGNFTAPAAVRIMRQMARQCGANGGALIGIDRVKSHDLLVAAYNDSRQVTARFNLNLLHRINRELGADFDVGQFRHEAIYDPIAARIEMLLYANRSMNVHIAGETIHFEQGESILTEYSHKYTDASFAELAEQAGLRVAHTWTDPDEFFSVQYLTCHTRAY